MGGYRVRVEPEDPLAVDEELALSQRFWQRLLLHGFVTVISLGFWAPFLIGWLVLGAGGRKRLASGYRVSVQGGMLAVGNGEQSRTVPLDAIADVANAKGIVTVSVRGAPEIA